MTLALLLLSEGIAVVVDDDGLRTKPEVKVECISSSDDVRKMNDINWHEMPLLQELELLDVAMAYVVYNDLAGIM